MILILMEEGTMAGPHSSYSCLEIHICWKVEREARMEPPIQTEYFLSGGAMILILMELKVVSWMPQASMPRKDGWKRASGQRKRSLPMVMTWPTVVILSIIDMKVPQKQLMPTF